MKLIYTVLFLLSTTALATLDVSVGHPEPVKGATIGENRQHTFFHFGSSRGEMPDGSPTVTVKANKCVGMELGANKYNIRAIEALAKKSTLLELGREACVLLQPGCKTKCIPLEIVEEN